ncbi:MAG: glutamate synthase central domain-containing protein, partial [Planctomycetota bacterium]
RPLSHYFRQKFSQVTNPPIDPLREARVMSLNTRFKNLGNILASDETQTDVYVLESPFLSNGMYDRFLTEVGEAAVVIDCTYEKDAGSGAPAGAQLRACLNRIRDDACAAIENGAEHLVLSDEAQNASRVGAPMILAAGGVHRRLLDRGLRSFCSITVRSAEALDAHYAAVLVGVGATTVNPYLACESIALAHERGVYGDLSLGECVFNYKSAIEAGLLKILSKAGVSVISSYRGGCNFEALGLSRALVQEFFPGAPSRISGIGLPGLERKTMALHEAGFSAAAPIAAIGGFYRHRRNGEKHAFEARLIADLQTAVRENDYAAYRRYSAALADQDPVQLRELLRMTPISAPIAADDVESINGIRQRFVTPGMSLGALSQEAHGALNIAMN